MHKFITVLLLILLTGCKLNAVKNTHGVVNLAKKEKKITIGSTNKNDVAKILGSPSTKGTFDNSVWIYIERIRTKGSLLKFGRNVTKTNNVLVLTYNKYGILEKKEFYDINKSNNVQFVKKETQSTSKQQDFIYSFLSSIRQKVNNPLNRKNKTDAN